MRLPDINTIEANLTNIHGLVHIAEGGQKVVYKGTHDSYGTVVLKLVLNSTSNERTEREIDVTTRCSFSNVPKLFEWGTLEYEDGQTVFLIEQCISGITLRQYLINNGHMQTALAMRLMHSLLTTAVELEKEQLVHRDIKPENIMVSDDETFWLLDFGIARHLQKTSLTATAARFGPHTPGYAAPEQFRNVKGEINIRADLFSIGVVVYESITGTHPFADDSPDPLEILRRTETLIANPLNVPEDAKKQLSGLLGVMMAKYPSRRPPSALVALEWLNDIKPTLLVDINSIRQEEL